MLYSTKELTELNDNISTHMSIISGCMIETEKYGKLLLASPPRSRYPYIYPRDSSASAAESAESTTFIPRPPPP